MAKRYHQKLARDLNYELFLEQKFNYQDGYLG